MAKKKKKALPPQKKSDLFCGNILSPGDYIFAFFILIGFFIFMFAILGFITGFRGEFVGILLILLIPFSFAMGICGLALYVGRHAHELPNWLVYLCFKKSSLLCTPLTHAQWKERRAEKRKRKAEKT